MIFLYLLEDASFTAADSAASCWLSGGGDAFLTVWLGLFLFLATFCLVGGAGGNSCPTGLYANDTAKESADCVPCSVCEPGEGAAEPCGAQSDTVCRPCPEGHFSEPTSSGRECAECRSCAPQRTEASPCTPSRDRVCGSCSEGYFLHLEGAGGSECLRCSPCPADRQAVHWADCAGEPEENRCAPGEWTIVHASTAKPTLVKPTNTVIATEKTPLPTDHGTFVTMKSYNQLDTPLPPDSSTERQIAIVSLAFTVATTSAFFLSLTCLFRERLVKLLCLSRRRAGKTKNLSLPSIKRRRTHLPVQEVNGSTATESTYYYTGSVT